MDDRMIETTIGGATVRVFPELPVNPSAPPRRISVGAFFDRFGAAKWAILADESAQVRAVVRDASVRQWIDLANPDLPAGLAIIHAAGHAIDADAIVNSTVLDSERPA